MPLALENVLSTLEKKKAQNKLLIIFTYQQVDLLKYLFEYQFQLITI